MNQTLTKIIEDWIGDNTKLPTDYNDTFDYTDGCKRTLSDLRARVPELVEKIHMLEKQYILNTKSNLGWGGMCGYPMKDGACGVTNCTEHYQPINSLKPSE